MTDKPYFEHRYHVARPSINLHEEEVTKTCECGAKFTTRSRNRTRCDVRRGKRIEVTQARAQARRNARRRAK